MNFIDDPAPSWSDLGSTTAPTGDASAAIDRAVQDVDNVITAADRDGHDVVRHGRRYFIHRHDRLFPVFQFDDDRQFPSTWTRADCRPDKIPAHVRGWDLFDDEPHVIPGDNCSCGLRIYPTMTAATIGARLWPDRPEITLDADHIVFAGVEYTGPLAHPPTRTRTDDELGTLRARWLRITGPIYVSPRVGRATRRGLGKYYRAAVVKLDERPFTAVADGFLDNDDGPVVTSTISDPRNTERT